MNSNKVIQVLPAIKDEYVLFVSQNKQVKMEMIAYWGVVQHLDYDKSWETMTVVIRPIISDTLGYKLLEDKRLVAVKVSGSQKELEKQYAKEIKLVITKLEESEK